MSSYRPVSELELAAIIRELSERPLLAGIDGVRMSLAGAQAKLPVFYHDGQFSLPLNDAPSTHIIKPDNPHYPESSANEAFCMDLARKVGMTVPKVVLKNVGDVKYMIVERYDRSWVPNSNSDGSYPARLPQEDFCQAMRVRPENKYQNEHGPSLAQCFELVRSACTTPGFDVLSLINMVIFNYLIGNCDAHGKNFSLLRVLSSSGKFETKLAPCYDLLCTTVYTRLDRKMAMKLGGEYDIDKIRLNNFQRMAEECNLSKSLTIDLLEAIAVLISRHLPRLRESMEGIDDVAEDIKQRCSDVLKWFDKNKI